MNDRDPLIDIFPQVETSHFASIDWPDWPDTVYHPQYSKEPVKIFMRGIMYVVECLHLEPVVALLSPNSNLFIADWNPQFFVDQFEEIVEGDRSMLATFHSGAKHAIDKFREDMTDEAEKDGLGECVNALEIGVHNQFMMRIAGVAEMVKQVETMELVGELVGTMLEDEEREAEGCVTGGVEGEQAVDGEDTDDQGEGVDTGGAEAEGAEHGGMDEFVVPDKKGGRVRTRAKTKKAKKASKKGKGKPSK